MCTLSHRHTPFPCSLQTWAQPSQQTVRAVLITVPQGLTVEDLCFYREQQLAVLLTSGRHSGQGADGDAAAVQDVGQDAESRPKNECCSSGISSRLVVFETRSLPLVDVTEPAGHMDIVQVRGCGSEISVGRRV